MKFPDLPIPITGFKIEVDHWALGYYLFERLQEKFGLEQILDVNPRSVGGENYIYIQVKEKTPEIQGFSKELEEGLQEKGVSVSIILEIEKKRVQSKPGG